MFDEHGNLIGDDNNDSFENEIVNDNETDNTGDSKEQSFLAEDKEVINNSNDNNGYDYNNYGNNYSNNNSYNNSNGYNNYNGNNGYSGYNGYYNAENSNNGNNNKKNKLPFIIGGIAIASIALVCGTAALSKDIFNDFAENIQQGENATTNEAETKVSEYIKVESTDDSTYKDNTNSVSSVSGVYITDVSAVVQDVMPSIVAITSSTKVEAYKNYGDLWSYYYGDGSMNDGSEEYEETGAGSGIIVKETDTELLIVTNNHVIEGADALSILFSDGQSVKGVVKSTNETADIAIVAISLDDVEESTLKAIKVARLGDSNKLSVGEGVIAIGNALGYGQSVTTGVISAKDRAINVDDKEMIVLQTDAAINGGNSGGALLNSDGEVIGINVAKYSSSSYSGAASIEGMGFAIPISSATDIMENLMSKQTREVVDEEDRGALGITGRTLDASTASMYDMPTGVIVVEVIADGAAEKAGIQAKDIIVAFDDQSISTMDALIDKLTYYKAGETVDVTISRIENGEYVEKTVSVKLGKRTEVSSDK